MRMKSEFTERLKCGRKMKPFMIFTICLVITSILPAVVFAASEWEWRQAWNKAYVHGKLEVPVTYGKVDILTATHAIKVAHVYAFREGIGRALHYAYATKKKPGLALFMDGEHDSKEKFEYAKKLAESLGIKVWLMNDVVKLAGSSPEGLLPLSASELYDILDKFVGTRAEEKKEWEKYKNKTVEWQGSPMFTSKPRMGKYGISVKLAEKTARGYVWIMTVFNKQEAERLFKLKKDNFVSFTGKLTDWSSAFVSSGYNFKVENAKILKIE